MLSPRSGGLGEWFNPAVLKTAVPVRVPKVRILHPPLRGNDRGFVPEFAPANLRGQCRNEDNRRRHESLSLRCFSPSGSKKTSTSYFRYAIKSKITKSLIFTPEKPMNTKTN